MRDDPSTRTPSILLLSFFVADFIRVVRPFSVSSLFMLFSRDASGIERPDSLLHGYEAGTNSGLDQLGELVAGMQGKAAR